MENATTLVDAALDEGIKALDAMIAESDYRPPLAALNHLKAMIMSLGDARKALNHNEAPGPAKPVTAPMPIEVFAEPPKSALPFPVEDYMDKVKPPEQHATGDGHHAEPEAKPKPKRSHKAKAKR